MSPVERAEGTGIKEVSRSLGWEGSTQNSGQWWVVLGAKRDEAGIVIRIQYCQVATNCCHVIFPSVRLLLGIYFIASMI